MGYVQTKQTKIHASRGLAFQGARQGLQSRPSHSPPTGTQKPLLCFSLCHSSPLTRPSPTQLPVQCSQMQMRPASFRSSLPKTQSPYFLAQGLHSPLCLSLQAHLTVEIRWTAEPAQRWSAHSRSLCMASPTPLLFTYHNFPTLEAQLQGSSSRPLCRAPWHPPP